MEQKKTETTLSEMAGYILISPAILSIILFLGDLFLEDGLGLFDNLHNIWSGWGDGHSSTLLIYFGLMAISGAYLIKNEKAKEDHHEYDDDEVEQL